MIFGRVTDDTAEARVEVVVRGPAGADRRVTAVLDTGFTDELTLPSSVVDELALEQVAQQYAVLANGNIVLINGHRGQVLWDGELRGVSVLCTEGSRLLAWLTGHRLEIDVVAGGIVRISPLGSS